VGRWLAYRANRNVTAHDYAAKVSPTRPWPCCQGFCKTFGIWRCSCRPPAT
jgi:hypothetical protein